MRKVKVFFLVLTLLSLVAVNIRTVKSGMSLSSATVLSFSRIAHANPGESSGIKHVTAVDCICTDRTKGHSLDCLEVQSSGEVCTTDPLTKCYKLKVKLVPLSADAVICD